MSWWVWAILFGIAFFSGYLVGWPMGVSWCRRYMKVCPDCKLIRVCPKCWSWCEVP
jgi:hypothetical protein